MPQILHALPRLAARTVRERNRLVKEAGKGEFWKPCPGTTAGYYCCGYQILTPLVGCGMYCAYCVLQVYFERHHQVVYTNFGDLEREVRAKLDKHIGLVRFGTGEFADSLFLEPRLGLSQKIASLLAPYPNVVVEFKTKSANVKQLARIKDPSKVVIGFSMNTPGMRAEHEYGTASIAQRLRAARECVRMGFWVAFHFDPMIWHPQWDREYRALTARIFDTVQAPRKIAWWSLGGFRTTPALKEALRDRGRHLALFSGEMILGQDHKYRYFRPVRTAFYAAVQDEVDKHCPATTLYLCMESGEVWEASGMSKRIPRGLTAYLDERAGEMLGERNCGL